MNKFSKILLATALSSVHMYGYYERDVYIVARTIYLEARGEPYEGKMGVASVIYNRANGDIEEFASVCLSPNQFSCWRKENIGNLKIMNAVDRRAFMECVNISKSMFKKDFMPTIDATHYFNPKLASPSWGSEMKGAIYIGNHKFGKL